MALILGMDGGATKTRTMVLNTKGGKVSESVSGPTNYKTVGKETTRKNIIGPVLGLISKISQSSNDKQLFFESSCFGFSGCDIESDVKVYKKIIFQSSLGKFLNPDKTIICNDSKIGLEAGSDNKNRIMLICGTGSNCYGINESGQEAYANGWEYILGDEGSGYSIAIKALRAIMKAYDGRGKKTKLSEMVLTHLKLSSEPELVRWTYGDDMTKDNISSIAPIVCQAAEDQDKISMNILKEEAEEAEISVSTVARKIKLKDKDFDLVLVGSLFKCKKYFTKILEDSLKKQFDKINIKNLVKKPVEGAIKLALENIQ